MAKTTFTPPGARILAVGVGGGGSNAVNRMVRESIRGLSLATINTDAQALALSEAQERIQIGEKFTRGLGVGGDPEAGRKAAEDNIDELAQLVDKIDLLFVTAGMGGGTGTGAAPVIAQLAKEKGTLVVGVVTTPFNFEGMRRRQAGDKGIDALRKHADAVIVVNNERLFEVPAYDSRLTVDNAFKMADDVLMIGVRAITEVITESGLINLDFADVKAVMDNAGEAWLSVARNSGQGRAVEAAREAIHSPLLNGNIKGAKRVLFTISGSSNLTLAEVNQAAEVIRNEVAEEANVIFGVDLNHGIDDEVMLVLIATGFASNAEIVRKAQDKRVHQYLKGINDSDLDMPAFARMPSAMRHNGRQS